VAAADRRAGLAVVGIGQSALFAGDPGRLGARTSIF
jgi:hypothetical protein